MIYVSILGIVLLLALAWLALGVVRIGSVSTGEPIGNRTETALLLIDLQSVFWDDGPYSETEKELAEAAIFREVNEARDQGNSIVAVRQEWSIPATKAVARIAMKGQAIKGSPGTELADVFAPVPDHIVVKRVQDSFETGELDVLFNRLGVGTLRIAGLDFNYCVQKTALAAKNRGYDVTVVKDGTLSANPTKDTEMRMASHGIVLQ